MGRNKQQGQYGGNMNNLKVYFGSDGKVKAVVGKCSAKDIPSQMKELKEMMKGATQ